ncbi:MAG TPA: DUF2845 domain-containing protein [Anaeromyxobacteraceae bacterium]|nr:DUF2845 domain-containing protein [Anaeromyxobacteraceae bacterium]
MPTPAQPPHPHPVHRGRARALAAALLALTAPPAAADSIRCDGGIVQVGDSKLDLLGKCGAPTLREAREDERSFTRLDPAQRIVSGRSVAQVIERWTYNFGPSQFVVYVTLEAGRVTAVERGSYGYDLGGRGPPAPAIPRARCDHLAFHEGDRTFDVLVRCGEPALREVKLVTRAAALPGGAKGAQAVATRTVEVEVWTYDFGPQVLVRRLEFEEGVLVAIETGSHGYSR